jgi:hypothetical protein
VRQRETEGSNEMNHVRKWEWDAVGRLRRAPCLCDRCEGRRLRVAVAWLLAGAVSSVGLIIWACVR